MATSNVKMPATFCVALNAAITMLTNLIGRIYYNTNGCAELLLKMDKIFSNWFRLCQTKFLT